jgi:hypothetical protein
MQESPELTNGSSARPRCLKLHADDNVAVVLVAVEPGRIDILGSTKGDAVVAKESLAEGHKISLCPIGEGDAVVKCGVAIGFATTPIAAGDWVHTHNCRSALDERSHTLDPHSGTPTDTKYL